MTRLVSTIGRSGSNFSERRTYFLNESSTEAVHSAFALVELLSGPDNPPASFEMIFLGEPVADVDEKPLRMEANRIGIESLRLKSLTAPPSDRWLYLRTVMDLLDHSSCVLDITNCGVILTTTFVSYAAARRNSNCENDSPVVYAGRKAAGQGNDIHFHNPRPLLQLPGWAVAREALYQNLDSGPMANRIHDLHDSSYKNPDLPESRRLQQLARMIDGTTRNLTSALPLEAGMSEPRDHIWTEVEADAETLNPVLKQYLPGLRDYLTEIGSEGEQPDKTEIELNEKELQRQLRLARKLNRTENLLPAYLLARELLVNGAILGTSTFVPGEEWLDDDVRTRAAAPFYLINHWNRHEQLRDLPGPGQRRVAKLWGSVKDRRNELAHAGFCRDVIRKTRLKNGLREKLEEIEELVLNRRALLDNLLNFPFEKQTFVYPVHEDDAAAQLLRSALAKQEEVTSVILLVDGRNPDSGNRRECEQVVRDAGLKVDSWTLPDEPDRYDYWRELWNEKRREVLTNRIVSLSVSEGSALIRHTCRRLYHQISRFGIQARLVVLERLEKETERTGSCELVTIEHSPPS